MAEKKTEMSMEALLARLEAMEKELAKTDKKADKAIDTSEMTDGQKQALMERKFFEAMEEAKKETVTITLPVDVNGEEEDVFVSVNGYRYLIRRGEAVEVPKFVADVLADSQAQKLNANKVMKGFQDRAKNKE